MDYYRFSFNMTDRDRENLIVARMLNSQVLNDTDMLRMALEDAVRNSATSEQIAAARKQARKQIAEVSK